MGRYELGRSLGAGGMGVVYAARDTFYGDSVALKTVSEPHVEDRAVLLSEFRATAGLSHPGLVPLYELGCDEGTWYFTMELVEGRSLSELGPLLYGNETRVGRIAAQLATTLHAIHTHGLLHLDVKPSNVMVRPGDVGVLLDFGISQMLGRPTEAEGLAGTPGFIAPERMSGAAPGPGADWYALGVTLAVTLGPSDSPIGRLAQRLSDPDPHRRAGWRACVEILGAADSSLTATEPAGPLLGRNVELAHLGAAWREALSGRPSVVVLRGRHGVGKTSIARSFLKEIGEAGVWAVGCHPREPVSLRVTDALLDAVGLPPRPQGRYEPETWAAWSAAAGAPPAGAAGPLDHLAAALAGDLRRRARTRPTALLLDDVQWGDADSGRVLADTLIRCAGLPILVLCTWADRGADDPPPDLLAELAGRLRTEAREVVVPPLDPAQARLLAARALPLADETELAARIERAEGLPYLLSGAAPSVMQSALDDDQRALLETIAVAGRPLPLATALSAAGPLSRPLHALSRLHARGLVRLSGLEPADEVDCAHPLIREEATGSLSPEARTARHLALAHATESAGNAAPGVLAAYWRGAGHTTHAAILSREGAREAEAQGAWLTAAGLWGAAAACDGNPADDEARARALLLGGHRAEAGRALLALAASRDGAAAAELRLEGAAHLIAAGEVERGRRELAPVLSEAGLRDPRSPLDATVGALGALLRIALVDQWREPGKGAAAATFRARLCWAAARGLLATDAFVGMFYSVAGLSWALRSGDAELSGRLLAVVGSVILGPIGGPVARWGARLTDRAEALADASPSSLLAGVVRVGRCQQALLAGDWERTLAESGEATRRLTAQPADVGWEQDVATMGAIRALEELGRYDDACRQAAALRHAGQARGVLYAEVTGMLYEATNLLPAAEVDAARALTATARRLWAFPGFHMQHAYAVRIEVVLHLLEGRLAQAAAALESAWPALVGARLMQIPLVHFDMWELRARTSLAVGNAEGAARAVAALRASRKAYAVAWAEALDAAGARDGPRLGRAADALEGTRSRSRAALARWAAAGLEGRPPPDGIDGVVDPARWVSIQLPALAYPGSVQAPR